MVVFVESLEAADLRQQLATLIERHGFAGGNHYGLDDEGAAEGVVEGEEAFSGGQG